MTTLADAADLSQFLLNGTKLSSEITGAVTGGDVEATIEASPTLTLTLWDGERKLLDSELYKHRARMRAIGQAWELAKIVKSGDEFTLTFEPEVVAALRRQRKPSSVVRSASQTRVMFIRARVMVVKHPHIVFISPDLKRKTPAARAEPATPVATAAAVQPFATAAAAPRGLRVKTEAARPDQLRNGEAIIDVGDELNAPYIAKVAAIMAAIQENALTNEGDGVFQVLPSHHMDSLNVRAMAKIFYESGWSVGHGAIKDARAGYSPNDIAQRQEGSNFPNAYAQWRDQAGDWVDAFSGGVTSGASASGETTTVTLPYKFEQKKGEDAWTMSGRLADEVGRRRFVVGNRFYYAAEVDLFKAHAGLVLSEDDPGVESIDFDADVGQRYEHATVVAQSKMWLAPPGSVVVVRDLGPQGNGRWLVSSVKRGLFESESTIELRRLRELLAVKEEPPNETNQIVTPGTFATGGGAGGTGEWVHPLRGNNGSLTGKFGEQRSDHVHAGVDLAVPSGTPIYAAKDGDLSTSSGGGYGNLTTINHGGGIESLYGHQSAFVKTGGFVRGGELIGKVGSTGHSSGPHLHFEIRKNGQAVCPRNYVSSLPSGCCLRQSI